MLASNYPIKFSTVIEAVADSIANVCANVNGTLPSSFDSKTVKEWTVTRQEIVTPEGGTQLKVYKTTKYSIILNSAVEVKNYSKNDIILKLNELINSSSVTLLKDKRFYVAAFLHVIKILLKYINDSIKIYISPYYSVKVSFFSPPADSNYNLNVDIEYDGTKTYTDEQIKAYIDSIAELAIYSLPTDSIYSMTYTTSVEEGAEEIIEFETINATFNYTDGNDYFTLTIPITNYSLYYKVNNINNAWTLEKTVARQFPAINNTSTQYYFKIVPKGEDLMTYKILGDDNRFGFKLTKTSTTRSYTESKSWDWLFYSPYDPSHFGGQQRTSDNLERFRQFEFGWYGYNSALSEARNLRKNGEQDYDTSFTPAGSGRGWCITWKYYPIITKYYTVDSWSGNKI